MKKIKQLLQKKKQSNHYRRLRVTQTAQQVRMCVDGRNVLVFCSNDYLGLANHPKIVKSFQEAANHYGVGSGAAHLINGHSYVHQQLEEELADFTGRSNALLFSTGYMANLAVISALMDRQDIVYQDRLNHASLLDASQLSQAKMVRYRHQDVGHLQTIMQRQTAGDALIVSDGVFSMDGDLVPLTALINCARRDQVTLMIDDAHGIGVLGKTGAGLLECQGVTQDDVAILVGTLGKAFGTAGAFVAGCVDLIDYLRQSARPYMYTTAMPSAIAAATCCSLQLIRTENWRREKLHRLIKFFRQGAQGLNLPLLSSSTPIQPLLLGSSEKALAASDYLWQQGFLVTAIRPPTVPKNTARLRITLSANHSEQQVEYLLETLAQYFSLSSQESKVTN